MKTIKLLPLLLAVFMQACKLGDDHVVTPTEKVPANVMASIKEKYPQAGPMEFSVLEEDKVYQADFVNQGRAMSVVSSNSEILATARAASNFKDSVQIKLEGLAVAGGVASNYRILEMPGQPLYHVVDYLLNGIKYTLNVSNAGYVQMSTRELSYETKSLANMPDAIQKFVNDRSKPNPAYVATLQLEDHLKTAISGNNELKYTTGSVYYLANGKKRYQISVKYYDATTLNVLFDENANLLWVGNFNRIESFKNFDNTTGGLTKLAASDINHFKNIFNAAPEFQGFSMGDPIGNPEASMNVYGGLSVYEFLLTKAQNDGSASETWSISYDASKNLIGSTYYGYVK